MRNERGRKAVADPERQIGNAARKRSHPRSAACRGDRVELAQRAFPPDSQQLAISFERLGQLRDQCGDRAGAKRGVATCSCAV